MNNIAIKVEHLNKIYRLYDKPINRLKESLSLKKQTYSKEFFALKDISFEINKGETIGIIGKNGSGKSTLLKIITGVLNQTSGKIYINGKVSALLELGTGFNPEYTGIENIYLNGTLMGYSYEQMDSKLKEILDFADIGEFINQPVKTYSSGMFARLAFAVAINVDPEILIVDEALSVGDVRFQLKCMNKMDSMMKGGTTVLFVSHDINAIKRFCSRTIWLNEGKIEEDGDSNRVSDEYLTYLKFGNLEDEIFNIKNQANLKNSSSQTVIANLVSFKLIDKNDNDMELLRLDDYLKIEVMYDVYDETIKNPVLGIAIRGLNEEYICGLNTLLDKESIPWQQGRNKFYLEYPKGLRVNGGKYFFDVALFDETATVQIEYIKNVKYITVISEYKGEGNFIIPHKWRRNIDE